MSGTVEDAQSRIKEGYNNFLNQIQEPDKVEVYGFFQAVSHIINMFMCGKKIVGPLSEGSLEAYFISPMFINFFSCFSKISLLWGEMCLHSSSERRNRQKEKGMEVKEVEEEEIVVMEKGVAKRIRRRIGQKTDLIGKQNQRNYEFMIVEEKPPQAASSLVKKDRTKIIKGMKDMLDFILLSMAKGATYDEIQDIFVIGIQITGHKVTVSVMSLIYKEVYMFKEVDEFYHQKMGLI